MRKIMFKKAEIKKITAVILAGAMCFGATGMGQTVIAKQNICSCIDGGNEDADNNSAGSSGAGTGREAVTGDAVADRIAQLHNPIIDASAGAVEFSYIYFGSYPQSEVTGEELTDDIINAEYVSGDAVVNGEKYRRMTKEDMCEGFGTTENFGKNKYRYFKYEPLKWKVIKIEGETAFLLSVYALNIFHYGEGRKWMNGTEKVQGFMGDAFSEEQQEAITYTEKRWWLDKEYKINYIRLSEFSSAGFFDYVSVRLVCETDYAHARTGVIGEEKRSCAWWLDKVMGDAPFAGFVANDGSICINPVVGWTEWGNFMIGGDSAHYGIVPSLALTLTDTTLWDTEESLKEKEEASQQPKPSTPPLQKQGDVNFDGNVNLEDVRLALKAALNLIVLGEKEAVAADMDEDGDISLKDAKVILKAALNLSPTS